MKSLLLFLVYLLPQISASNLIEDSHLFATKLFKYFDQSGVSDGCNRTAAFVKKNWDQSWAIQCKRKIVN